MGKGSKPRPVDRKKWDESPLWQNISGRPFDYRKIQQEREDDFQAIMGGLNADLSVEIFYSAMNRLKSNPEISIAEAMEYGYNEWVR